jgi:site-specific recombinase XerD
MTAQKGLMTVSTIDVDLADRYLQSLAPAGRQGVEVSLARLARLNNCTVVSMPWSKLRAPQVVALIAKLKKMKVEKKRGKGKVGQTISPSTIMHAVSTLRGILTTVWEADLMTDAEYHKAVAIKGVKGSRLPAGRDVARHEVRSLLDACDDDTTPAGVRDSALIALLLVGGFRRDEVTHITMADVDLVTGRVVVTAGKGSKQRVVYVVNALPRITQWVSRRGHAAGPLFCPVSKSGIIHAGRPVTAQAVYNALTKRADHAGLESVSPHDLRRTYAGNALTAGVDIATVARQMGHASVTTTARYDRRNETTLETASRLVTLPS